MRKKRWLWIWALLIAGPALGQQDRFRKSPPVPDPLPALVLPEIERTELINGLTVAVVSRPGQPFISLDLVIRAGESQSPETLPGLASFTAEMLSRGTALVSAAEFEERIDGIGGEFRTTVTPDFSRLSLRFLDDSLDRAIETLSQMVLQPDFSEREIVALKRTLFYDLKQKQKDPEFVGRRQLLRVLFKSHPYGRSFFNEEVFKNLTRKDVQAFYELYYRPNNALLALSGNVDLATAVRRVGRYLSPWARKEIEWPSAPSPRVNSEDRVCFVNFPEAQEATLVIGNVVFPFPESDYFPLAALIQVLGGTPFSRLFMNLREAKEYAYSAFSKLELFQNCACYTITAAVVPSAAGASIREIRREIDRLTREKVGNFELEQAKSYLIGNFPIRISPLDQLNRYVSELLAFSWGESRWNRFGDNVILVDSEQLLGAAQKHLLPKPVVVIVGDMSLLFDSLQDIDRLEVYDLKGNLLYTMSKGVEE